jgi:hypothetical protein
VIEVQTTLISENDKIKHGWNGYREHLGYINKLFETKREASYYYKLYNPHMREINAENRWCSECDPKTKFVYVIREYTGELLKIPPFDEYLTIY